MDKNVHKNPKKDKKEEKEAQEAIGSKIKLKL